MKAIGLANRALNRLGYQITTTTKHRRTRGWNVNLLRKNVCVTPKTIYDIGVGTHATPPLAEAFPSAYFYLIDPVPSARKPAQEIIRKLSRRLSASAFFESRKRRREGRPETNARGEFLCTALGEKHGDIYLKLGSRFSKSVTVPFGSSLNEEKDGGLTKVPLQTLDFINQREDPLTPVLVKIHANGHELPILKGAQKTLETTHCVIVHVATGRRAERNYISEVSAFLEGQGFVLDFFVKCQPYNCMAVFQRHEQIQ